VRMSRFQVMLGCCMALILAVSFGATSASADTIDFEGITGPTYFGAAGPSSPLTIALSTGSVTFTGGVVLTDTTNLPADETSVYGTLSAGLGGDPSYTNPITMTFSSDVIVSNLSLTVFNGLDSPDTFTVSDGQGDSTASGAAENFNYGQAPFDFSTIGNTITITSSSDTTWDYFIDNISFTVTPTDPVATPEPSTITLLGAGLAGIAMLLWRRGSQASELAS
jgi:hypothetical protein